MFEYIFTSVLEVSMAVSFFLFFFLMFMPKRLGKYAPRCRTFLWMIFALRLLFPFQMGFRLTAFRLITPYRLKSDPRPILESAEPGQLISLIQMMAMVWLVEMILFFAIHLIAYGLFERKLLRGTKTSSLSQEEERIIRNQFYEVKYQLGIYDPIRLWISSEASGPMLIGFFHPKVVVPDCMMEEQMLSMVFRHELMHHRRHDAWYRMLMLATASVHWFNPVVHLMTRRATEDLESACDQSVVAGKTADFVGEYARALLNTAKCLLQRKKVRQTVLVSYFSSSAQRLKKRFMDLFAPIQKRGLTLLSVVFLMVVLGSRFVFVQGNDQNLDWAENLREGDISSVEVSGKQLPQEMSNYAKKDVVDWFSSVNFKPALYRDRNRVEEECFRITKKDGSNKTVSLFSDGTVQVDGKEYRAYGNLLK